MKKSVLGLAVFGLLVTGCQKQPESCFTTSTNSIEVNNSVSFSDCSENAVEYEWEFGDGTTSTDKNPTHTYNVAGYYTVTLTTTSKNGKKSDEATASINVNHPNEKFAGTYSVSETCDAGSDSYTMTIQANGSNGITVSGFLGGSSSLTGTVNGNNCTINPASAIPDATSYYWDMDLGATGTLNGNVLTLTYEIDDILYENNFGYINCSSVCTK